ncbi:MAG: phosphodiester glycosidase family protein [Muribaculaceae bacterium]|nr:phosphodiester glycosidase family protein [Muribaculaceae bacterium]
MRFRFIVSCTAIGLCVAITYGNCYPDIEKPDVSDSSQTSHGQPFVSAVGKTPTLLITDGWESDTISEGLIYHNFNQKYDDVSGARQIVNVLELDLTNPAYTIDLCYVPGGSACSDVVKGSSAIAGTNAGYEMEAVYVKVDNVRASEVTLAPDHLRFWKHEGAIHWTTNSDMGLTFAGKDGNDAIAAYKADRHCNLISSAPMLIENYDPCGTRFAGDYTAAEIKTFNGEDYRRHQGVRHPRTAVAVTDDRDLLLITVDGRWPGKSEGMTAKELTNFLVKYFNPKDALNMDGGGSTTMVVDGHGDPDTHVVNQPTDNGIFDHTGQRHVPTHFVIKRK